MSDFLEVIHRYRKQMGYSQTDLASLAEVSLPTIQILESGRGNPSLAVLLKLLKVFGLRLNFQSEEIRLDILASGGVPLMLRSKTEYLKSTFEPELRKAWVQLCQNKNSSLNRESEALLAYMGALADHYPKAFRQLFGGGREMQRQKETVLELRKKIPDGRWIKLRRLAIAGIKY